MMKTLFFLLIVVNLPFLGSAQAVRSVEGIVFDQFSGQRVAKAFIRNDETKENTFNNSRGEFSLHVEAGEKIIVEKEGYFTDTLTYAGQAVLLVYMRRSSIYIPEVRVVARQSPDDVLKATKEAYRKSFNLADPGDVFTVGPTGAGISINAIYSLFSREVKQAKRLTKIIQEDYEANVVDYNFTRDLVSNITGLKGDQLTLFMRNYRPSYNFVKLATPYQLSSYIKGKYEMFKLNPNLRLLPELPQIHLDVAN